MIFGLVPAPISVAIIGTFDQEGLSRWMGNAYQIKSYRDLAQAASASPRITILNQLPQGRDWVAKRDNFVPKLESQLAEFRRHSPHTRIFVVLPTQAKKEGFTAEVVESELVPLLRQASEESDVATILLQPEPGEGEQIAEAVVDFSAQKSNWHLVSTDSEEVDEGPAINAIDGKPLTYWHTRYSPKPDPYPHYLEVDMASEIHISGFRYVPRQDGGTNGRVKRYQFSTSEDGKTWSGVLAKGTFKNTSKPTVVRFASPVSARYFKFEALSEQEGQPYASAAEIDVIPAP